MSDTHADEFPAAPSHEPGFTHEGTIVLTEVTEPLPPCHVMLDLETWGTGNKAVIVSIGACKFDRENIIDSFHVGVDPTSCTALGLEVDVSTILWWMDPQQREALDAWLQLERVDLASALVGFDLWCKHQPGIVAIWGNGSTFDNVILRSAFAAAGLEYPVRFWADQCYRTKKNEAPGVPMIREGQHHRALDDAISQAKHLQAIWRSEDPSRYIEQLRKDEKQFTFYGEQHRAKLTPEADAKAEVNEALALEIRAIIDDPA